MLSRCLKKLSKPAVGTFLLVTLVISAGVSPQPSYAVIGLATGTLPTVLVGAALAGPGLVGFFCSKTHEGFMTSTLATILGLLIMDDKNDISFEFSNISDEQATAIGLDSREINAYRDELIEINLVKQSVEHELLKGASVSDESGQITAQQAQASKDAWDAYSKALSPEAYSAVQKIASAALQ